MIRSVVLSALLCGSLSYLTAQSLSQRYEKLSCAVVRVEYEGGAGTAFFVNATGRMATVAHVLYERKYKIVDNLVVAEVTAKKSLKVNYPAGSSTNLTMPTPGDEDSRLALFDLAITETKLKTPCFIPLGESDSVKVGQHLSGIGFPASST